MYFPDSSFSEFLSAEHGAQSIKYLCTAEITGSFYTDDIKNGAKSIKVGDTVELRREPENKFDTQAVAVYNERGYKLGYISKYEKAAVANVMDSGRAYCFGKISVVNIKRSSVGMQVRLFFMSEEDDVLYLKDIIRQNLP